MSTVLWDQALQGVTPAKGGQSLPPATYRLKAVAGQGKKTNSGNGIMLELQFEVVSGPLQGRKQFHNENLPSGNSDNDKNRMAFFLGLMDCYGITGAQLSQMFAGQPITVESVDYIAKHIVSLGSVVKGTARPQAKDPSRINLSNWTPDDGIEPEPPKQNAAATPAPGPFGQQGPGGLPGQGAPGGLPPGAGGPLPGQAPGAGNGMPLGGFPGSGGMQPNAAPAWSQAPAAQAQAQPNQFQQQAPVQDQGFPGQQFQGQVNPAQFPAQNQAAPQQFQQPGQFQQLVEPAPGPQNAQAFQQQGFVDPNAPQNDPWSPPAQGAPGQMPGIPQGQPAPQQFGGQPQGAPGLPTGGFPQGQQPGGAPQASF